MKVTCTLCGTEVEAMFIGRPAIAVHFKPNRDYCESEIRLIDDCLTLVDYERIEAAMDNILRMRK